MANNYISRGDTLSVDAKRDYKSGEACRINGFNGIVLEDAKSGDSMAFQLVGIFQLELSGIKDGDAICITNDGKLKVMNEYWHKDACAYGRAVTGTDSNGRFLCHIEQSFSLSECEDGISK